MCGQKPYLSLVQGSGIKSAALLHVVILCAAEVRGATQVNQEEPSGESIPRLRAPAFLLCARLNRLKPPSTQITYELIGLAQTKGQISSAKLAELMAFDIVVLTAFLMNEMVYLIK